MTSFYTRSLCLLLTTGVIAPVFATEATATLTIQSPELRSTATGRSNDSFIRVRVRSFPACDQHFKEQDIRLISRTLLRPQRTHKTLSIPAGKSISIFAKATNMSLTTDRKRNDRVTKSCSKVIVFNPEPGQNYKVEIEPASNAPKRDCELRITRQEGKEYVALPQKMILENTRTDTWEERHTGYCSLISQL